jgi:hypothetical protein
MYNWVWYPNYLLTIHPSAIIQTTPLRAITLNNLRKIPKVMTIILRASVGFTV